MENQNNNSNSWPAGDSWPLPQRERFKKPPPAPSEAAIVPEEPVHTAEIEGANEQAGTSFADRRPIVVDDAGQSGVAPERPIASCVPEENWSYSELVTKPVLMWFDTISTKNTPGTILGNRILPEEVPDSIQSLVLNAAAFNRINWRVRLQVNAPKFAQGKVMLVWHPANLSAISQTTFKKSYLMAITTWPHSVLDIATSSSCDMVIPFVQMFDCSYQRKFDIGTLSVIVLNQLRGEINEVDLSLWIMAEKASTHIPIKAGFRTSNQPFMAGGGPQKAMPNQLFRPLTLSHQSGVEGALLSALGGSLSGVTNSLLKNVPGGVSQDYDKPPLPRENVVVNRIVDSMATSDGVDHSYRLSLSENAISAASKDFYSDSDPNLNHFKHIETMVDTIDWDVGKDFKYAWSNNPTVWDYLEEARDTSKSVPEGEVSYPIRIVRSMLGYISAPFCYWRGSLNYRLQFVSTPFHTGRLIVAYIPAMKAEEALALQNSDLYNYPNMIIDLQDTHDFTFSVPYTSITPWTRVAPPGRKEDAFVLNMDFKMYFPSSTGSVVIRQINKLSAPASVAQTVSINIWVSGGPDFELKFPQDHFYPGNIQYIKPSESDTVVYINSTENTGPNGFISRHFHEDFGMSPLITPAYQPVVQLAEPTKSVEEMEHHGGAQDVSADDLPHSVSDKSPAQVLIKGGGKLPQDFVMPLNESHMNIKHLIRRFARGGSLTFGTYGADMHSAVWEMDISPFHHDMCGKRSFQWFTAGVACVQPGRVGTMLGYFSALYRFWRGSIRYKFRSDLKQAGKMTISMIPINHQIRSNWTSNYDTDVCVMKDPIHRNLPVYNMAQTKFAPIAVNDISKFAVEIECPYYSVFPVTCTKHGLLNRRDGLGEKLMADLALGTPPNKLFIYVKLDEAYNNQKEQLEDIPYYVAAGDDFSLSYPVGVPVVHMQLFGKGKKPAYSGEQYRQPPSCGSTVREMTGKDVCGP